MSIRYTSISVLALTAMVLSMVACGTTIDSSRVTGVTTIGGKPLAKAILQFFPLQGRPIIATTDDEGRFGVDLAPGDYQVTVNINPALPPGWKEGDPVPPQPSTIPTEYTTRARTPLKATVVAGQTEPIDFVLP